MVSALHGSVLVNGGCRLEIWRLELIFVVVCDLVDCLFYKQKTAYEMRISDWSSDVGSSDLSRPRSPRTAARRPCSCGPRSPAPGWSCQSQEIGRASCRDRVCQYV